MFVSGWRLAKHRIEGNQLKNVDRFQLKPGRDPGHALVVNVAEVFLPKVQQRQSCAPFVLGWIMADRLRHFPLELWRDVRGYGRLHGMTTNCEDCFPWMSLRH